MAQFAREREALCLRARGALPFLPHVNAVECSFDSFDGPSSHIYQLHLDIVDAVQAALTSSRTLTRLVCKETGEETTSLIAQLLTGISASPSFITVTARSELRLTVSELDFPLCPMFDVRGKYDRVDWSALTRLAALRRFYCRLTPRAFSLLPVASILAALPVSVTHVHLVFSVMHEYPMDRVPDSGARAVCCWLSRPQSVPALQSWRVQMMDTLQPLTAPVSSPHGATDTDTAIATATRPITELQTDVRSDPLQLSLMGLESCDLRLDRSRSTLSAFSSLTTTESLPALRRARVQLLSVSVDEAVDVDAGSLLRFLSRSAGLQQLVVDSARTVLSEAGWNALTAMVQLRQLQLATDTAGKRHSLFAGDIDIISTTDVSRRWPHLLELKLTGNVVVSRPQLYAVLSGVPGARHLTLVLDVEPAESLIHTLPAIDQCCPRLLSLSLDRAPPDNPPKATVRGLERAWRDERPAAPQLPPQQAALFSHLISLSIPLPEDDLGVLHCLLRTLRHSPLAYLNCGRHTRGKSTVVFYMQRVLPGLRALSQLFRLSSAALQLYYSTEPPPSCQHRFVVSDAPPLRDLSSQPSFLDQRRSEADLTDEFFVHRHFDDRAARFRRDHGVDGRAAFFDACTSLLTPQELADMQRWDAGRYQEQD